MRRLVYLRDARNDILDIQEFVTRSSGSAEVGRRFIGTLRRQCQKLASLPGTLGRPRPELGPGFRSFPNGNYLIFFRYVRDTFEVIGIVEGHCDLDDYFDNAERSR